MTIKRLTENLKLDAGDSFILFYGQVNDEFCDDDLCFGDIDLMLWRYFHAQGYQRIVYYEGAQKIYWLDAESERLCRGVQQSASFQGQPTTATTGYKRRLSGPMGVKTLVKNTAPPLGSPAPVLPPSQPASTARRPMSDLSSISIIHHILSSPKDRIPTVVVFTHADDINQAHFEGRSFRDFQNRLVKWARASSQGLANLCVFIFQETSRENILECCKRNKLTALTNTVEGKGDEGQNVIQVGYPDKQELLNVIHYHRLINQMNVDWFRLDRLAAWVAAEVRKDLNFWKGKLTGASSFSRESIITWFPKRTYSDKSAEEQLNELIGLSRVKQQIKEKLAMARQLGGDQAGCLHMAFLGNPGTGKTVVAGLVGEIFREAGLLQRGHTVVADRTALVGEFEGQTAPKTNGLIDQALDGILFVDEAHQLIREGENDPFGIEAVKTLVPRMEGNRDRLCVILAGYPAPIKRLIAQDPGLQERVQAMIEFDDYSPAELVKIFRLMARKKEDAGSPPVAPEAMVSVEKVLSGLYETRNPEDWGNARVVRNFLDAFYASWAVRFETQGGEKRLLAGDIPEKYRDFVEVQINVDTLFAELNLLTGLAPVKSFVKDLMNEVRHDQHRVNQGLGQTTRPMLHMLFMGNPGTGKTTVARLMGKIFKGLGILPRGHVVPVTGGDLLGQVVGEGVIKTKEKVREALGGVLFIDEIYGLTKGSMGESYGADIIHNVLVPAMTDHKDRLVVVGAGYTHDLEEFLKKNEGLRSRFVHHVTFPDFKAEELLTIFERYAARNNYRISSNCRGALSRAFIAVETSRPRDFGNARVVEEEYFGGMRRRLAARTNQLPSVTEEDLCTFTEDDLPDSLRQLATECGKDNLEDVLAEINNLTGLLPVKEFLNGLVAKVQHDQQRESAGVAPAQCGMMHMLFQGNPGTGKTTVARLMGKIFKALGILPRGQVIPVTAADLVGSHVGEGVEKAKEKVQESLGGILFIDEIYGLSKGSLGASYGADIIHNVLVPAMTDHKDRLVVVGAGYTKDLEEFLKQNEGLRSRFVHRVEFPDFNAEELLMIFERYAAKNNYRMSAGCREALAHSFAAVVASKPKDFGNARVVEEEYFGIMQRNLATRTLKLTNTTKDELCTFTEDDLPDSLKKLISVCGQNDLRSVHQKNSPGFGQDVVTSHTPSVSPLPRRLLSMSDIPVTSPALIVDSNKGFGAMGNLKLVLPAVGFVEVTEANGDSGTGSGFVITPDGKFLTCYHVTENAQSLRVRFDNDPHKYYEAVYLDGDRDADIALLQLSSGSFDHALLISSGEEVQLGDEVGLLGYPLGTDLGMQVTYTKGVISSFRKTEDDAMLYQIDANAYPGSSGGPLFRQSDGRVVGILKGGFKEERAPGINFAVSVQELFRRLVKEERNALPVEAATTFDNQ